MIVQVVVVIIVCIAASLLALTLAGASLAVFAKLLKRTDEASKEQRL
jgi:hypothetical protein